jgi:hypothetical protein
LNTSVVGLYHFMDETENLEWKVCFYNSTSEPLK